METPANDNTATPARRALAALAGNSEDTAAMDTLASSDVLVPVPDEANEQDAIDPGALGLPVIARTDVEPVLPLLTAPENRVVAALSPAAKHVDRLCAEAGIGPGQLLGLLLELELRGFVESLPARHFRRA